jgi:putative addiction module component (TIGR02574 family)
MATIALSEIRKLSVAERIQLVEDIWDSVAADAAETADIATTEPQRQELDRRLSEADIHPGSGAPWQEVKARLLGNA